MLPLYAMNQDAQTIRIAIVEDRPQELEAVTKLLSGSPGFVCVAACRSAEDALALLPECRPDIILMDIQLPGMSGIECVRQLRGTLPTAQVMMLTVFEDHNAIFRSLAAGASGYLLKKTAPSKLLEAIRELHDGGAPMSGQIARQVVAVFRQSLPSTAGSAKLSLIEQSVLQALARGLLYKEVADELGISVSTVRTHVWHIYRKLHVHNRTEAVLQGLTSTRR